MSHLAQGDDAALGYSYQVEVARSDGEPQRWTHGQEMKM
jgi:hypothetical protein